MNPLLKRLARAVLVGLLLGAIVFWWVRKQALSARIREVRVRVTPRLKDELEKAGVPFGNPIFIRIFKESRELEVWIQQRNSPPFTLWKTFQIAALSGKLGPKLVEGDGQTPEGFYAVSSRALNPNSAFHLSFDIGYPNRFDQTQNRTGSWIMVHGGTASVGCFAMTDPAIEEIYLVAEAALQKGQSSFAVHVFPFRMSEERMLAASTSEWLPFWENLRVGYVRFEESKIPPTVFTEGLRYGFR